MTQNLAGSRSHGPNGDDLYLDAQAEQAGREWRDRHGSSAGGSFKMPAPLPPDESIDYWSADAAIGDIQAWLVKFRKPLTSKLFDSLMRQCEQRREELRKEREALGGH